MKRVEIKVAQAWVQASTTIFWRGFNPSSSLYLFFAKYLCRKALLLFLLLNFSLVWTLLFLKGFHSLIESLHGFNIYVDLGNHGTFEIVGNLSHNGAKITSH